MKRSLFVGLLLALSCWSECRADTNTVDPKADAVLRGLSDYFRKASSFKVEMEAGTRIEAEDMKQEFTTRAVLIAQKPAKMLMTVRNGMIGPMMLASDGVSLTTFLPAHKRYTVKPAPASLELLSQEMGASSPACLPVISALLESDPYAGLVKGTDRIDYLGLEKRGEVECHHLIFRHREFDCEAWIRSGPQPLIESVKPCLTRLGEAGPLPEGIKTDVILKLSGWEVDVTYPDSLFHLDIPDDARKSDTLIPGMDEAAHGADEEEAEDPDPGVELRDKPAPTFALPLLAGGRFDLAAQQGRKATVICFWTTWANPCRATLPMLEKIAADYTNRPVSVVSINPQESPEAIREYLKEGGLRLPVALDRESEVAELYRVAGIPQIVVIDKGGIVRDVFVGYGKALENDLRGALNTLIGGTVN